MQLITMFLILTIGWSIVTIELNKIKEEEE